MSTASPCQHVTLAKNPVAHIQRCTECGCVCIHLGAVTVRLDAQCLEALCAVLGEAVAELHLQSLLPAAASQPRGLA
jgi:hypothetical protein